MLQLDRRTDANWAKDAVTPYHTFHPVSGVANVAATSSCLTPVWNSTQTNSVGVISSFA